MAFCAATARGVPVRFQERLPARVFQRFGSYLDASWGKYSSAGGFRSNMEHKERQRGGLVKVTTRINVYESIDVYRTTYEYRSGSSMLASSSARSSPDGSAPAVARVSSPGWMGAAPRRRKPFGR